MMNAAQKQITNTKKEEQLNGHFIYAKLMVQRLLIKNHLADIHLVNTQHIRNDISKNLSNAHLHKTSQER